MVATAVPDVGYPVYEPQEKVVPEVEGGVVVLVMGYPPPLLHEVVEEEPDWRTVKGAA